MSRFKDIAKSIIKEAGYKITQPRLDVLEIFSENTKPLSAYEIQAKLTSKEREYKVVTIYRILETLEEIGLIFKIFTKNGYIKNPNPEQSLEQVKSNLRPVFAVCENSDEVKCLGIKIPIEELTKDIKGFTPRTAVVEFLGSIT